MSAAVSGDALNAGVSQEYSRCQHDRVQGDSDAKKVLQQIEKTGSADKLVGLHQSGHFSPQVAKFVPDLQQILSQVAADVASGVLSVDQHGEYVAYIQRVAALVSFGAQQVPTEKLILDVYQQGQGSPDASFRAVLAGCTAAALRTTDQARGDRSFAQMLGFTRGLLGETQFRGDTSVQAPSRAREAVVLGGSAGRFHVEYLPLYHQMLQHGSPVEAGLAIHAMEGFVVQLKDPRVAGIPGYVAGLKQWLPPLRDAVSKLEAGHNRYVGSAVRIPDPACSGGFISKDRVQRLLRGLSS
jgi:hypothetical protein